MFPQCLNRQKKIQFREERTTSSTYVLLTCSTPSVIYNLYRTSADTIYSIFFSCQIRDSSLPLFTTRQINQHKQFLFQYFLIQGIVNQTVKRVEIQSSHVIARMNPQPRLPRQERGFIAPLVGGSKSSIENDRWTMD